MRELTFDAVSNDPRHKTASRIKYILKLPKSLFDVHRWLVHLYKALELADCCKWFPHSNICLEAVRIWINLINSFIIELTNTANHDFSVINQIVCTFQLCTRVKPRAKEFSNTFFLKCWNQSSWAPGCWMSQLVKMVWMFDKDMEWLKFILDFSALQIKKCYIQANFCICCHSQVWPVWLWLDMSNKLLSDTTAVQSASWSNIHFVFLYTYIRFIKTGMNPMLFIYIHVQSNSHYLFKEEANLLNQQINRPGLQTRNNLCTTPTMH